MNYSLAQKEWLEVTRLKKGDFVRVMFSAESRQADWPLGWITQMNSSVGKIMAIKNTRDNRGIQLDDGLKYPFFILVRVVDETES